MGALARLVGGEALTAMLHVEATRAAADGVFVDRGSVIALARPTDWPQGAARDAVRAMVDPVWTKAHLGMRWIDARIGTQTFSQLEGLEPVAVAERGRLLFVASDPALLAAVLDATAKPAMTLEGAFAGGFRHALERGRFVSVDVRRLRSPDRTGAAVFSRTWPASATRCRVDSASIVMRDRGAGADGDLPVGR